MAKRTKLVVNLPGLVSIFGDALYQDFGSIVRELIQNSHDAILANAISKGRKTLTNNRIDVKLDDIDSILVVADNGVGMDVDGLSKQLNNFASSEKRDMREAFTHRQKDDEDLELANIIGEYGVGFLSVMAVSDRVTVCTRKIDSLPAKWVYESGKDSADINEITVSQYDEFFSENGIKNAPSGTIVVAELSENTTTTYEVDENEVRAAVIRYASLLPIQVYYNEERISGKFRAWNQPSSATDSDWSEMIVETYQQTPAYIIPVYSPPDQLDVTGVFWIPEREQYFYDRLIDVYVKRMFVVGDTDIIAPSWGRFIRGCINSNKVQRIVSGNTIKNNNNSKRLKEFIKDTILKAFGELRRFRDEDYQRIIGPHDEEVKGSAVDEPEFMDQVWDKIRIPSRNRRLTLPDYLKRIEAKLQHSDVLFYYDKATRKFQADLISDSTGIPILDLSQTRDKAFVSKLAEQKNWKLLSEKELASQQFQRKATEDFSDSLVTICLECNIDAEVREFEPSYVPAVLIEDDKLKSRRDDLLSGLKQFGEKHLAENLEKALMRSNTANWGISFYLNAANPLIRSLPTARAETQATIVSALYNISFMSVIPDLKPQEIRSIYSSITEAMQQIVANEQAAMIALNPDKNAELHSRVQDISGDASERGLITLFMMTPFAEKYKGVETAVRSIFEGPPFFFRLLLARDYTHDSSIMNNLRAHIARADGFVAEITDLNPNVMLELGAALYGDATRPVLSLRAADTAQDIPVDLRDKIHISYSKPEAPISEIRQQVEGSLIKTGRPANKEFDRLIRRRSKRFLSDSIVSGLPVRIDESGKTRLLQSFVTLEDVAAASDTEIANKSGIPEYLVTALKRALADLG